MLVLAVAVLGGTIVYAQAGKVTTTYRTALVTYGTITQSIGMAGNLTPVNEADLNFASAGTVSNLYVQVGQTVGDRDSTGHAGHHPSRRPASAGAGHAV